MQIKKINNPIEFKQIALERLYNNVAKYNFEISMIESAITNVSTPFEGYIIQTNLNSVPIAIRYSNKYLIVSDLSRNYELELVDFIYRQKIELPGVVGFPESVKQICDAWDRTVGCKSEKVLDQEVMACDKITYGLDLNGEIQEASNDQLDLATDWLKKFQEEKLSPFERLSFEENKKTMTTKIASRCIYFLWVNKIPVCMSGFNGRGSPVVRIAPVYTPLKERNKKYAQSLVSKQTESLLKEGYQSIFLNVDKNDPAAVRVYSKIGFEKIGEFSHYVFKK